MKIEIDGYALRLLDSFVHYSTTCSERMADAMWWCEDSFIVAAYKLKKIYDDAVYTDDIQGYTD